MLDADTRWVIPVRYEDERTPAKRRSIDLPNCEMPKLFVHGLMQEQQIANMRQSTRSLLSS